MSRASTTLGSIVLLVAFSGCGESSNSPPPEASAVDYGKQSQDKMAGVCGVPKAEKPKSSNASDMMNNYSTKK